MITLNLGLPHCPFWGSDKKGRYQKATDSIAEPLQRKVSQFSTDSILKKKLIVFTRN
jgi:hypothetical protein